MRNHPPLHAHSDYRDAPSPRSILCECGESTRFDRQKRSVNGVIVSCSKCVRRKAIAEVSERIRQRLNQHIATRINKPITKRTIYRDVAVRYLTRFDGNTETIQTEIDDCEVVLKDRRGKIIGQVSMLDRYPKPPADSQFADMPF